MIAYSDFYSYSIIQYYSNRMIILKRKIIKTNIGLLA
jgi:hypothetical protein